MFVPFNCCAQEWIRTITPVKALRPEHSASTNFATWAALIRVSGSAKVQSFSKLTSLFLKKFYRYLFVVFGLPDVYRQHAVALHDTFQLVVGTY